MNIKYELGNWVFIDKSSFQIFRNCEDLLTQEEKIFVEKISLNSSFLAVICLYAKPLHYFFYENETETETADIYKKIY